MAVSHTRPHTTVLLFDGRDLDPLAERRASYQRAAIEQLATGNKPLRIGDDPLEGESEPESAVKAREHDEFLEAAIERATKIKMAAMPRKAYGALLAEHPARADK